MDAPLVEEDSNLYDVLNVGDSPNPDEDLMHDSLRTEIERSPTTLTPRRRCGAPVHRSGRTAPDDPGDRREIDLTREAFARSRRPSAA